MWFENLTGISEYSPSQVRENLSVDGDILTSHVNGKEFVCGRLEIPSLSELRQRDVSTLFRTPDYIAFCMSS